MAITHAVKAEDNDTRQYAALMGINEQLHLRGKNFSNAVSAFWIAYLIAEISTGQYLRSQ